MEGTTTQENIPSSVGVGEEWSRLRSSPMLAASDGQGGDRGEESVNEERIAIDLHSKNW